MAQTTAPGERVEEQLGEEIHQGSQGVHFVDRVNHNGLGVESHLLLFLYTLCCSCS